MFPGWQPRWFVLDGGTLSYYDSQEDAWKGCKGSIKISVCEIQGQCVCDSLQPVCEYWMTFGAGCDSSPLHCALSSPLWLHSSGPDHPWRAVLLPQSHQRSREAEMAGGTGNSQSLPYRQPDKERKRYLSGPSIHSFIHSLSSYLLCTLRMCTWGKGVITSQTDIIHSHTHFRVSNQP